jgi:hypothetical protein
MECFFLVSYLVDKVSLNNTILNQTKVLEQCGINMTNELEYKDAISTAAFV